MNFSPLLQLLLISMALTGAAALWVWLRQPGADIHQRLRVLAALTLFLTFDLVLFGAFTRLSDSGLGCPDWPGCYGHASPVGAVHDIAQAQIAMPTGPVTHQKAWIEMLHRYLASGVGGLMVLMAALSWRYRKQLSYSPWWPTVNLAWVCVQGALGAFTVTWKLFPAIVTLHLLGGMVLLILLYWQLLRLRPAAVAFTCGRRSVLPQVALALLFVQIALGAWVSSNYAVLACQDFPLCQGSVWPEMNFKQAFELWRPLGMTGEGAAVSFPALTAIHYVHRLGAVVVLAVLALLAWRLRRQAVGRWLAALMLLQWLTGISNVVFDWPLFSALLHTGGAAALVLLLARISHEQT